MAHVQHNSGNNEWYTPLHIIEAATQVLDSIDTDPASNSIANAVVQAKTYYTADNTGLDKPWYGNVWMNPPYSSELNKKFCNKLKEEVLLGNVKSFITLTNNATETKWFKDLYDVSDWFCFTSKRIRFVSPDGKLGKQPLQGQVLCMHGNTEQKAKFIRVFSELGMILSK